MSQKRPIRDRTFFNCSDYDANVQNWFGYTNGCDLIRIDCAKRGRNMIFANEIPTNHFDE